MIVNIILYYDNNDLNYYTAKGYFHGLQFKKKNEFLFTHFLVSIELIQINWNIKCYFLAKNLIFILHFLINEELARQLYDVIFVLKCILCVLKLWFY